MEAVRIPIHALMHELDLELEAEGCTGNGLLRHHWYHCRSYSATIV
jgi:hypothetical protein